MMLILRCTSGKLWRYWANPAAGKSSLINLAGGLLASSAGYVAFRGKKIQTTPPKIAVVFQDACLLPWLTIYGNVDFALRLRSLRVPADERQERVRAALREVGLEDAAHRYPAQLSGGMAQRVALACFWRGGRSCFYWMNPFRP